MAVRCADDPPEFAVIIRAKLLDAVLSLMKPSAIRGARRMAVRRTAVRRTPRIAEVRTETLEARQMLSGGGYGYDYTPYSYSNYDSSYSDDSSYVEDYGDSYVENFSGLSDPPFDPGYGDTGEETSGGATYDDYGGIEYDYEPDYGPDYGNDSSPDGLTLADFGGDGFAFLNNLLGELSQIDQNAVFGEPETDGSSGTGSTGTGSTGTSEPVGSTTGSTTGSANVVSGQLSLLGLKTAISTRSASITSSVDSAKEAYHQLLASISESYRPQGQAISDGIRNQLEQADADHLAAQQALSDKQADAGRKAAAAHRAKDEALVAARDADVQQVIDAQSDTNRQAAHDHQLNLDSIGDAFKTATEQIEETYAAAVKPLAEKRDQDKEDLRDQFSADSLAATIAQSDANDPIMEAYFDALDDSYWITTPAIADQLRDDYYSSFYTLQEQHENELLAFVEAAIPAFEAAADTYNTEATRIIDDHGKSVEKLIDDA